MVVPSTYNVVFNAGRLIIDTPASMSFAPAAAQSSPLGTPFASPLSVQIAGTFGEALAGVPITFTSTGMTFSSATVITPASGAVSVIATPTAVGNLAARATVVGTSFAANFSEIGTVPASAILTISSGSGQTAVAGARFALPLAVLVVDKSGRPLPNASVSFSGIRAQLSASTVRTNSSGIASITASPTSVGRASVTATLVDVRSKTVTFTEMGTF